MATLYLVLAVMAIPSEFSTSNATVVTPPLRVRVVVFVDVLAFTPVSPMI
jgi:hypothetical protein